VLDRCQACGGVWLDKGELEGILRKVTRLSLGSVIDRLLAREEPRREGCER
jgi:Zn-finger nucleic acid-binding protein